MERAKEQEQEHCYLPGSRAEERTGEGPKKAKKMRDCRRFLRCLEVHYCCSEACCCPGMDRCHWEYFRASG